MFLLHEYLFGNVIFYCEPFFIENHFYCQPFFIVNHFLTGTIFGVNHFFSLNILMGNHYRGDAPRVVQDKYKTSIKVIRLKHVRLFRTAG